MAEHHVSYVRDSDRRIVTFVYSAAWLSEREARERAASRAPHAFRWVAYRLHEDGPFVIPVDGADYGASGVPVYTGQMVWGS